jgi:hypothetical protein
MEVVDPKQEFTLWAPVNSSDTVRTGMCVHMGIDAADPGDGVISISAAAGASDTTGKAVPYGIIIGVNDVTQTLNFTDSEPEITGVVTQATQTARTWFGQEGMWSKGDGQALVQLVLIDSNTKIKIPIWGNSTIGTALTLLTSTTQSTTGLGFTTNALDFTPVADYQIFYCRTGSNAGLYRISETTNTTVHTFQVPWTHDVEIGDTFVAAPVRPGLGRLQTDSSAIYLNADATPTSDYYAVNYDYIDLREAGKEHAIFRFSPEQFNPQRT